MKFRPLNKRLLIEPVKPPTTSGGIIIPEAHRKQIDKGKVIAAAKDCLTDLVGSTVHYTAYAGSEMEFGGVKYQVMDEQEILAVEIK